MSQSSPRLFPRGLWNVGWRYLLRHRWQSVLMVLGIALGVAVMVAIDLANASASRAFELSTESITGRATHQITGGALGVDDKIYSGLHRQVGDLPMAPVISEYGTSPQLGGSPMQLLGIDPFADSAFRPYLGTGSSLSVDALTAFLTRPGAVFLERDLAARYHLELGAPFELDIDGHPRQVFVAGLLDPADALQKRTLEGTILADISTAQELTGRVGRIDWIDLLIPGGNIADVQRVQSLLPVGLRVETVAARQGSVQQMTSAFQLNLTMLSLLALIVGLFLIYNTMTFSVVQRRALFGTLRCLGVTRYEVFGLVISEALLVGILGSALGIGLGVLMGRNTVGMVTQTINDLYFTTTVNAAGIPLASLVKGAVAGILATVLTAGFPAWEAASVPPQAALSRSGLETKTRRVVLVMAAGGVSAIGLGLAAFSLPQAGLLTGFGGTTAVIVGFAMLAALAMVIIFRGIGPLLERLFGLIGRMAPRSLVASLSRTAVAVAALMVAVAVTVGVTLMIDSFRYTVNIWLAQTLQGDVYITAPSFTQTGSTTGIDPAAVQKVQTWPGLQRADLLRTVMVDTPQGQVQLSATDNTRIGIERLLMWANDPPEQIWQELQQGKILISEPLARRYGLLARGSSLTLYTPQGPRIFPVEGVYYDYASSEGALFMALPVYRSVWQDNGITAIALRLKAGVDADAITTQLQDQLGVSQHLLIRPNQALRADVMAVFDRTFAITAALRILATVVAFIGVLNTLLLLQLEKQREVGILRALGLSGGQLWRLTMLETGLMGLAAGLLAAPTGYALALILVYVINQRSFGWTLQLSIQPAAFFQALVVALVAALLAGIYPAGKMSRQPAAEAIRYE
jgi:putative ABC transport system permease protein